MSASFRISSRQGLVEEARTRSGRGRGGTLIPIWQISLSRTLRAWFTCRLLIPKTPSKYSPLRIGHIKTQWQPQHQLQRLRALTITTTKSEEIVVSSSPQSKTSWIPLRSYILPLKTYPRRGSQGIIRCSRLTRHIMPRKTSRIIRRLW